MDIQPLLLAYTAAALVAVAVTAAFSASIEKMLFHLLPEEVAPHWARFVKFAVFAASFTGGLPVPLGGGFVDPNAPEPPPPDPSEGLMIVMNSASGALMAASWVLLAFFSVTLLALTAGRAYRALRKYREEQARAVGRRKEPAETRPVAQDKPAPHAPPQKAGRDRIRP